VVAQSTERLQVRGAQPQVPVAMQRLDVIDIHPGPVLCGAAAGEAGGRAGQVLIGVNAESSRKTTLSRSLFNYR
jgi:hypothetical protein